MKQITVMMMLLNCIMATGQPQDNAAKAPAKTTTPQLSDIERIAIQATVEKLQLSAQQHAQLLQQLHVAEAAIAAAHPGYHWDEQSGSLVANALVEDPKKKEN